MYFKSLIVLFFLFLFQHGIAESLSKKLYLKQLEFANPYQDLKLSISKKDFRFIALQGFGIQVPGIRDCFSDYKKTFGFILVEGTSDVILGYEQGRLTAIARYYAEKYNRQLEYYIYEKKMKKDGDKCGFEEL